MKPFNINTKMRNEILNSFGAIITGTAIFSNFIAWLSNVNINQIAALSLTIISLIYMIMKMYDQYLITKKRKKENF